MFGSTAQPRRTTESLKTLFSPVVASTLARLRQVRQLKSVVILLQAQYTKRAR